mmetsp:Transcript_20993/g.54659  ORF Transcript_20993/g.54659 Transcript_20993/m.54659 type:complete len:459 (+) Transcript_20993:143-1519(+)
MGKPARRGNAAVATNELASNLLDQIFQLYVDKDAGLIKIAGLVGRELLPPRQKITVLLCGNHSSGKSSFINWYIDETVQKAGVAMVTSTFTFVTSGIKRQTLTGEATIELFPHMKGLEDCAGVANCITTEIVTSQSRSFPMITFVDTPGLIDGDAKYPYDIDAALQWLGRMSDVTLVFFDPIGQALRKHTIDVVEKMCSDPHSDFRKMHFYLSKADTAGSDRDRQKVIVQMSKELFGDAQNRPGMARVGTHAEIPTIYIPKEGDEDDGMKKCPNDISEVVELLDKTIKTTIQNTLNNLKSDAESIAAKLDKRLVEDAEASEHNWSARIRGIFYTFVGMLMPIIFLLVLMLRAASDEQVTGFFGPKIAPWLLGFCTAFDLASRVIPSAYRMHASLGLIVVSMILFFYSTKIWSVKPRLSSRERSQLEQYREYLANDVIKRQKKLYKEYLAAAVGADHKL